MTLLIIGLPLTKTWIIRPQASQGLSNFIYYISFLLNMLFYNFYEKPEVTFCRRRKVQELLGIAALGLHQASG